MRVNVGAVVQEKLDDWQVSVFTSNMQRTLGNSELNLED